VFVCLVQGLSLGFANAAQPGPFLAFLLSHTLRVGWRRTLLLTLAPLATDGPIIALVLLILVRTPDWFIRALSVVGGLLLIYFAKGAFDAFRKSASTSPANADSANGSFARAFAMNATSPGPYIFWTTIGGPTLIQGWAGSPAATLAFVAAFYLTLIGGLVGYVLLFAAASRIDPRLTRALNLISAVALFLFGVYRIWQGVLGV